MSATTKKPKRSALLPRGEKASMLKDFDKMSPHDQAVIFLLIQSRAAANAQMRTV
jgi:hypothetical protein